MGYRSDLRVILKKEGLDILKDFFAENEDSIGFNPMNSLIKNKEFGDIVYLGWHRLNGTATDFLESCFYELEEKEISYRYCCIGESLEDIKEQEYISKKDSEATIPYISYIRDFDEEYTESELNKYQQTYIKNKEMESIDYEPSI